MGPTIIFDKSLLQSLSAAEVDELDSNFEPVCVPTLVNEIIGDLAKAPTDPTRLPSDVVQALSRKMAAAHGLEPISPAELAAGELLGRAVPMTGTVPVGGPHVQSLEGGRYISYDATPQQRMWMKWASGDFCPMENSVAEFYRLQLRNIDLHALASGWREFVRDWLGNPNTFEDLLNGIDRVLSSAERPVRREVLRVMYDLIDVGSDLRLAAYSFFDQHPGTTIVSRLPYSTHVLKVYMAYACSLARGLAGPRTTDRVDLQYLFFAPFCQVFTSSDRFHRYFWPAVTSSSIFVWGPDLKNDLARRAELRTSMTREDWKQHRRAYGIHPVPIPGSVVSDVWDRQMGSPRPYDPDKQTKTIEELPQHVREQIARMTEALRRARSEGR